MLYPAKLRVRVHLFYFIQSFEANCYNRYVRFILIFIFLALAVPLGILLYKNSAGIKQPDPNIRIPSTTITPFPTHKTQADLSSMLFVVDTHTTIALTNSLGENVGNLSTEGGIHPAGSTNTQPSTVQLLYSAPPNGIYKVKASSTEHTFTIGMYLYDKNAAVKMEKFENFPNSQTLNFTIVFDKQDIRNITVKESN